MFHSDLTIRDAGQPDLWVIAEPLVYVSGMGQTLTVPKGFITDLASIPHWLDALPFLDRTGASRRPAALHDWAYAGLRANGKNWCDALLAEALRSEGLTPLEAGVYFKAVHWFGARAWAFDGNRHPYDVNEANLEACDFITQADWQAWIDTCPVPNEDNHVAVPPKT